MLLKINEVYYYWAYGLTVFSDFQFPELMPISDVQVTDVCIIKDFTLNDEYNENKVEKSFIYIDASFYRLVISEVGIYEVSKGSTILIKPFEMASENAIRLYCLSNAFAALLQQRSLIPLHCAALRCDDKSILLFGHSGSGKSTTLLGLNKKGCKVISDDVVVPKILNGKIWVDPSYPMIKLWRDTIERFDLWNLVNQKIYPDMEKYGIYFHDTFSPDPIKPKTVIFLEKSSLSERVVISKIEGITLFTKLNENIYRGSNLNFMDMKREHFRIISSLAFQVDAFEITRPENLESYSDVLDAIFSSI